MLSIIRRTTFPQIYRNVFRRKLATKPDFTKDRYNIKRGNFTKLNQTHYEFFEQVLGTNRVIRDSDECESFNIDWVKTVRGNSNCVLQPKTTEEVSQILKFCDENKIAVCPQGGNTGLVGGSVPVFDEVIISLSRMNRIESIDELLGAVVCEAGCVLENIDNELAKFDFMVPLDLGSKASCQIGGNASTNAGGLRLLRYGNLHGNILGLEAVKANGEVINCLNTLKKDNTGYHLKHLFIGSEGTLGIVTRVAIQCVARPNSTNVAFLGLNSFQDVLKTFRKSKKELTEILSSFELIDAQSLNVVQKHFNKQSPIGNFPFYILVETQGSCVNHDEEKLNNFLSNAMNEGIVLDGVATNEVSKMRNIWELRELITPGLQCDGYVFKYDFSIPLGKFYNIVERMREILGEDAVTVCGYGHIGDSNLHLNITTKEYNEAFKSKVEPFVYKFVSELQGSVSAEHGIGFQKTKYLQYSKSSSAINLMIDLKKLMDPNGILNPYKVLANNTFNITPGPYTKLTQNHIEYFRQLLGDNHLTTDSSDLEQYNIDWLRHLKGNSSLILHPTTTEEISNILKYCNTHKLPVVPQAGNTSLVGGSVPVFDEIILSTSKLNKIYSIDDTSGVLVCDSGCILEHLEIELEKQGYVIPLDLGAKGSCQIGGNVATNAGGLRLFRFGNLHSNVLGLEVVKADGEVLDLMSSLKKDNTGYHLKNIFIGSEGTLGVITKVAIQCPIKPSSVNLMFMGLQSFDKVLKTFKQSRKDLGEILSSVEVIDGTCMEFVSQRLGIESPIGDYPFYLLIETSGSNEQHDQEKMHNFLEYTLVKHLTLNGTLATEPSKIKELWKIRERIADSFQKDLYVFCYDFTMPHSKYYQLVEETRKFMGTKVNCVFGFGHLADGNLHLQIAIEKYTPEIHEYIEAWLIKRVIELNGSISAEHGIGFLKRKYLKDVKTKATLSQMHELKQLFDPNHILNPYKSL